MKRLLIVSSMAVALVVAFSTLSFAEEKSIEGEAKCAMCILKVAKACQTVIEAKEGDKTVTYDLAANDESKKLAHKECTAPVKVKATGTVKEEGGKMVFTASKLEVVQ